MLTEEFPTLTHYESEESRVKERIRLMECAASAVENVVSHLERYKARLGPFGAMFLSLQNELDLADAELEALRIERRMVGS